MKTTPTKTSAAPKSSAQRGYVESYSFTAIMTDGVLLQSSGFTTWFAAARHIAETYRAYPTTLRALAMVSSTKWADGHLEFRATHWVGSELAEVAANAARTAGIP